MLREGLGQLGYPRGILLELNTPIQNGYIRETTVRKRSLVTKINYTYPLLSVKPRAHHSQSSPMTARFYFLSFFLFFFGLVPESSGREEVGYGTERKERRWRLKHKLLFLIYVLFLIDRLVMNDTEKVKALNTFLPSSVERKCALKSLRHQHAVGRRATRSWEGTA